MFNRKLTFKLQTLSSSDFRIALFVAMSLAIANAVWVVWDTVDVIHTMNEMAEAGLCTFGMTLPFRSMRIGSFLLVAAVCLRSRKAKGFYISVLSLTWVCAEYGLWYAWSQRILINADIPQFPAEVPHAFGLYGAAEWDAIVLLISGVLLLWEGKTYAMALAFSHREEA